MFNKQSGIKYDGGYQFGDTILQRLQGPTGEGKVLYPNGDSFKGYFHLNYAHIYGPAYAAEGEYTFADGSRIDHAWINTTEDFSRMGLHGIFRVQHPDGPDTITPFNNHLRDGLEIILTPEPYAAEWSEGEKIQELQIASYEFKELDENLRVLSVILKNGTKIIQKGGGLEDNGYGSSVFKTALSGSIAYPEGDVLEYFGYHLRGLQPWNGYILRHTRSGKKRDEQWAEGRLESEGKETWSYMFAKSLDLPDPFSGAPVQSAVWPGRIEYSYGRWIYEGDIIDDKPSGKGVLTGDNSETRGRRYEGEFRDGLCHGHGKFTNDVGGYVQDGTWVKGVFQESRPQTETVILKIHIVDDHWSMGGGSTTEEDLEQEAAVGPFPQTGFWGLRIERIEADAITFCFYDEAKVLTKGGKIHFSNEVEGREYSDGCVYDGDDYTIRISWPE